VRRDQMSPTGAPLATTSLELRRARLVLWGHMFTPHLKYYAHLMFAPKDLGFKDGVPTRAPIFQWYTAVTRLKHAHVQAGFFFVPYARQRMQPLPRLQFADNSTASYEFTLDQDIGVQVSSPDIAGLGMLRYYAGVFMGEGYDWHRASDFGLTYMGRVEVLPLGMFEDFSEADFERPMRPKLSVGAAYAFSDRDRRTRSIAGTAFADGGSMSAHNLTADLMFKWAGLSVLADVYWRRGWRKTGGLLDAEGVPIAVQAARNGFGWTAQMGLFVPRTRFEAVARTAGVRPPRSLATSLARLDEVGGGLNYYFYRHALKLQLDYIHTWGPALPTGRGDQLRLQLQFIF
jgi:phosphate-selective porin OprO/OprP